MTRLRGAALAALVLAGQAVAQGPPVRALSSNGVRAALEELVPQCEREIGARVVVEFGTSAAIRDRVQGGEAADVVFATTEVATALVGSGKLAADSVTPLGRAGIGIGIRAGTQPFDITTPAALKAALLAARSVTYAADGASRPHIERMFERLGIAAEMKAKTLLEQGSVRAAAKVVGGEADVLLTLVSEILPVAGMDLVGALPEEYQGYVSFVGALRASPAPAARALMACVAAPDTVETFAARGIAR